MFFSIAIHTMLACGDKSTDTSTDTTDSSDTTDATDTTDTTDVVDAISPVVVSGDAWCFVPGGSTEGEQWGFTFNFTDPQGIETVPRLQMGAIRIYNAANIQTSTQDPACSWETGSCTSYPFSSQVGVGCGEASNIRVEFQITDVDGNTSNILNVQGREGTNFEG